MTLRFCAQHHFGNFTIDAQFEAAAGVTALFGKSGSGKTSILKMIAGLIRPDAGEIHFDGKALFSSESGVFTPPHRRQFSYVFQEPRLFPHMSVSQNLRYGAWMQRRHIDGKEFTRIVEMLGISELLTRRPHNLSGGEQQRVAIGRALLAAPQMLLMDEPLASLDQQRKAEILPYLEELCAHAEIPIIYVSHSLNEVMRLASKVVLLDQGRVTSLQSPQSLHHNAAFLAALERNELGAMVEGEVLAFDDAQQLLTIGLRAGQLIVSAHQGKIGSKVKLFIAARDVMLGLEKPSGLSALNIVEGQVTRIDQLGNGQANISLTCAGEEIISQITTSSLQRMQLQSEMPIYAIIKAVSFEAL